MADTLALVTGNVGLLGTAERDKAVAKAWLSVTQRNPCDIYVLGTLFAPGADRERMETHLRMLPGRLVLVTDNDDSVEAHLPGWYDVYTSMDLQLGGGQLLRLSHAPSPGDYINLHATKNVPDDPTRVYTSWDLWQLANAHYLARYAKNLASSFL